MSCVHFVEDSCSHFNIEICCWTYFGMMILFMVSSNDFNFY